jgi:hypothetical protein
MKSEGQFLTRLYWWSYAVRAATGLVGWYCTIYLNLNLIEDAGFYNSLAASIAKEWLSGESSPTLTESIAQRRPWSLLVFIASIYWLNGGEQFTPLAILAYALVTAWAPVLTYRIGLQVGAPERGARFAAWLVVWSPAFAFWSGALYKEGFILVALNLGIYHLLRLQDRFSLWSIALLVFSILALYSLRFYLALILGGVFLLGLLLGRTPSRDAAAAVGVLFRQLLIAAVFIFVLVATGFTETMQRLLPSDLSEGLEKMATSRADLAASSGSGFGNEVRIRTPLDAAMNLAPCWVYFMTAPWPWQFGSLRQSITVPETLAWVLLTVPMLHGIRAGLRKNMPGTISLLVAILAISCFYSLWIGNVGTVYRMRIQVWILLAVFAGWGWVEMGRQGQPR